MLEQYSVENFKSFKRQAQVNLKTTNYKLLQESNAQEGLLKGVMFVGANASGKSNIVLALKLLLELLFGSKEADFWDYRCLFSHRSTTKMEYVFRIKQSEIKYSIAQQRHDQLLMEQLTLNGEEILDRLGSSAHTTITEKTDYNDIPHNVLLVRDIWFNTGFRGNPVLQQWMEFLSNSVYFDLLSHQGTGQKYYSLNNYLNKYGVESINQFFEQHGFGQTIAYSKEAKGDVITFTSTSDEKMVFFQRKGIKQYIPLQYESLGNKTLLDMLPSFFHVINNGGMLILDEFSSGFHNDLEKLLIKHFMQHAKGAQLMIVSHSTNLLASSLLRPDQLYAVNFNQEGSNIVRFSDEQPRAGQNFEKMYLGGVFSGLPNYDTASAAE